MCKFSLKNLIRKIHTKKVVKNHEKTRNPTKTRSENNAGKNRGFLAGGA